MQPTSVVFLSVNYNSDADTRRHIASLRQLNHQDSICILVVDNTDRLTGNPLRVGGCDNAIVVEAPRNLGYFGGASFGLAYYLRDHALPEWVIVSNVDLIIQDRYFVSRLSGLNGRPGVGAVAPSIRSSLTGRDQNPFIERRPSAARMHAYKWIYRSRVMLNGYELGSAAFHKLHCVIPWQRRSGDVFAPSERRAIYAAHGSCLILAREYFRAGGTLEFPCFLFGEEIYVAESLRALGLEIIYEPSLVITHREHASTRLVKPLNLARAVAASAAYCADKYFPWH